jgi:hypothetical protein
VTRPTDPGLARPIADLLAPVGPEVAARCAALVGFGHADDRL